MYIYICTYILVRLAQRNSSPLAKTWPIMACYGPCMRQVTNICKQLWASQVSEVLKLQVGQMNIISVWIYVDLWYILYIHCHYTFTYVGCLEVCSLNMIARHFCRLYIHMMYNMHIFNYISYVFFIIIYVQYMYICAYRYTYIYTHTHTYTHTPKSLQCLRLTAIPNQNARHDPCPGTDFAKPLSPLETLALTSLGQTIIVLFVFDRIPSERRFPTGLFSWALLTPTNKNAKQALFLVCILQDGFW